MKLSKGLNKAIENVMGVNGAETRNIRVVIADDNKEMREAVIALLEGTPGFEVVGAVGDGRALVTAVTELAPDIGIVDISMPIMNGILAATEIKRLGSGIKMIFLTVNEDCDFVRAAFETGASGYVIKRQMATDLSIAIDETLAGRTFVSAGCEIAEA